MTVEKLLALARSQIGVTESPKGSNTVRYNSEYYGREVAGGHYAWCAVFIWWLFRECEAKALYFKGGNTAYCPTLLHSHISAGEQVLGGKYEAGDIVFFNFNGKTGASHVGICECFDGEYITTIDGNTGTDNEANGGAVMRRKRAIRYVVGGYRPRYEEEIEMTQEQFDKMADDRDARRALQPCSGWAVQPLSDAVEQGITDGTRPQSFATRQEVATMILNAK